MSDTRAAGEANEIAVLRCIMDEGKHTGEWERLQELCGSVLSQRPLILASNRGPIEHYVRYDGRTEVRRGSGGVVTALSSLTRMLDFTWVATAMGEGDRRVAEESRGAKIRSKLPGAACSGPLRFHSSTHLPQVLQRVLQSVVVVPAALHVELSLQSQRGLERARRMEQRICDR